MWTSILTTLMQVMKNQILMSHVDKENQEPTDCPANVNIEPGQSKKYIKPYDRRH